VVLATDGVKSFAIFEYADLQWASVDPGTDSNSASESSTSGSGSGSGSGSEIELTPDTVLAQVGFSAGDGVRYYSLSGSGTDEVLELNSTSNVERAGVWIFRVDGSSVEPGGLFEFFIISFGEKFVNISNDCDYWLQGILYIEQVCCTGLSRDTQLLFKI